MIIAEQDLRSLRRGEPPADNELLADMTLESESWLDGFNEYYLNNYVASGGSKVKILIGSAGTGKTHLLRCAESRASMLGYYTVYFSMCNWDNHINDLPNLYRTIACKLDHERLVKDLCQRVAATLGYEKRIYSGDTRLLKVMMEKGLNRQDAEREICNAIRRTFRDVDIGSSFSDFVYLVARNRMITGQEEGIQIALKWLCGQKMEKHERQATGLLETLQKTNAYTWLNSLICLLNVLGRKGLVVLIDDLEVPFSEQHLSSEMAIEDAYELLRQLIDDVEMLSGFMMMLAGGRDIVGDVSIKGYEALWMRLQTEMMPADHFNPFTDMIDVDAHLGALGPEFSRKLSAHMIRVLHHWGCHRVFSDEIPDLTDQTPIRAAVMEIAWLVERTDIRRVK